MSSNCSFIHEDNVGFRCSSTDDDSRWWSIVKIRNFCQSKLYTIIFFSPPPIRVSSNFFFFFFFVIYDPHVDPYLSYSNLFSSLLHFLRRSFITFLINFNISHIHTHSKTCSPLILSSQFHHQFHFFLSHPLLHLNWSLNITYIN